MTKELRNNLLFLGLFLAISVPGAVMLFIKKLDPEAKPMYLPAVAPHQAAYMHPISVAQRIDRIVPAGIAGWTDGLRQSYFPGAERLHRNGPPIMSEGHYLELLAVTEDHIGFVLWADTVAPAGQDVTLLGKEQVPAELVESMKDAGYPVPPVAVSVLSVPRDGRTQVELSWDGKTDVFSVSPSLVVQEVR